jgi:hypothetical protein
MSLQSGSLDYWKKFSESMKDFRPSRQFIVYDDQSWSLQMRVVTLIPKVDGGIKPTLLRPSANHFLWREYAMTTLHVLFAILAILTGVPGIGAY